MAEGRLQHSAWHAEPGDWDNTGQMLGRLPCALDPIPALPAPSLFSLNHPSYDWIRGHCRGGLLQVRYPQDRFTIEARV